MRWFRLFPVGRRRVGAEVDAEIAHHLSELVRGLEASGLSAAEARAEAERRFGASDAIRARVLTHAIPGERAARRREWLSELRQDVRFGVRLARRQPGFTAVLLLILSLGIGAHTAIATAFHAVLVRPLPYARPDRLVHLWETMPDLQGGRSEASYPDFVDWRGATSELYDGLEGYDPTNMVLTGAGTARILQGARVTSGFLGLLGVPPALGRDFRAGEDLPGGTAVALVGHGFWQRDLGADSTVLGRSLTLNGRTFEIVGVLPRQFHFAAFAAADVLIPLDRADATRLQRFNHWLNVVGRLKDGVSLERARSGTAAVMARLAADYPETNAGRTSLVILLRDELTGEVRPILLALGGAVLVLLLVACTNAASLLVGRSITRTPELSIRTALGASRSRLTRQLLTEAVAIALAAGVAGFALASAGVRLLVRATPPGVLDSLPALRELSVDWRLFGYTLLVALLTGIAFGVVPGLGLARLEPGHPRLTRRRSLRDALVVGQLALTVVLLMVAGLLSRSLGALLAADPGFRADSVVTFRYSLSGPAWQDGERQQQFLEDVLERVRALPGVVQAGAVTSLPLQPGGTNTFRVEGQREPPASNRPEASLRGVAGDYFTAMGIRLVAGRVLSAADGDSQPPAVMLDENQARQLFGSASAAIGGQLRFYAFPTTTWTVVGVAGAVKTGPLDEAARATIYYAHTQAAQNRMSVVVRADGSPAPLLAAAQGIVTARDASVPFYGAETLRERVINSPAVFARRYPLLLIGSFAAAALALSLAGLYGVLAFAVAARTRELGLRAALGATPSDQVSLVLRQGGLLVAAGLLIGLASGLFATRSVTRLLYGVTPADPRTLLGVVVLLGVVALAACWIPARRAASMSPLLALGED